ncbi:MAG: ATP synthase F0 subunit B [Sandaracinaceae bacterium]
MLPTVFLSHSPILDVDATLLIYVGVFFLVLIILRALVFKPVMALFDERERAIDGAKRDARKLEKDAEGKLLAFEGELAKMRKEAGQERDRLRADAAKRERALLERVKSETDAMIAEAEAKMATEAKAARATIAGETPKLAREIAKKLLGREVGAP